jgi:hypothetical protein
VHSHLHPAVAKNLGRSRSQSTHIGAMKICVTALEAPKKKERQDETSLTTKIA